MNYSLVKFLDPHAFAKQVIPFLMKRESVNQIQLGMLNNLDGLLVPFEWMFAVYEENELVGVATKNRRDHFKIVVSPLDSKIVEFLAQDLNKIRGMNFAGVLAEKNTSENFAKSWCRLRNLSMEIEMAMGVFECSEIKFPKRVEGYFRAAKSEDLSTLLIWRRDYLAETELPRETEEEALEATEKIVKSETLKVWEVSGEIVSMANGSPGTPRGGRISLVYTPPHKRGNSYASALVAATTKEFFDYGKKFGFLNTDLKNPISNKIYERIGYKKVSESLIYKFQ